MYQLTICKTAHNEKQKQIYLDIQNHLLDVVICTESNGFLCPAAAVASLGNLAFATKKGHII